MAYLKYLPLSREELGLEILCACFQRRATEMGLRVLQWRSPNLKVEDLEGDVEEEDHRNLVLCDSVQATDLEEFKAEIVKWSDCDGPEDAGKTNFGNAYIFVNTEAGDRLVTEELCQFLEDKGTTYAVASRRGPPEKIYKDFEENLLTCQGTLLVYDQPDNFWVDGQLRLLWTTLNKYRMRENQLYRIGVYELPPADKEPARTHLQNMRTICCHDGLNEAELVKFLEEVENAADEQFRKLKPVVDHPDDWDVFLRTTARTRNSSTAFTGN